MSTLINSDAAASAIALPLAIAGNELRTIGDRLAAFAPPRRLAPAALAVALCELAAHPAAAQAAAGGTGSLDAFLTNVVNMITGTTGQAIAIIAVAVCGLGAMFGALSARAFGGVVLGCGIVFSAAWIVGKITGGAV